MWLLCKMLNKHSHKVLWDHCVELELRIHSCTALDIYQLDNEVPETKMKGNTADISNICKFKWYEWVMFNDSSVQFTELWFELIDIGSALTYKIMKSNEQIADM